MEKLLTFTNEDFGEIRTVEENGKIYFCGKDVATALGYVDAKQAITKNCKEHGVSIRHLTDRFGRTQKAKFIDEGNLYRLITHSKLPTAEKFESWVFDEVLPTIRQTGQYMTPTSNDSPFPVSIPDTKDYLTAARLIAHCPKSRLRTVLELLQNGGFDFKHKPEELKQVQNSTSDISERIQEVINITKLNIREIAEFVGMPIESLRAYYVQRRYPRYDRYVQIVAVLNQILENYETAKYEVVNYEPA